MNDFLNRAYRIVTDTAVGSDCEKTIIHACLSHVLLVSIIYLIFVVFPYFSIKGYEKNYQ